MLVAGRICCIYSSDSDSDDGWWDTSYDASTTTTNMLPHPAACVETARGSFSFLSGPEQQEEWTMNLGKNDSTTTSTATTS